MRALRLALSSALCGAMCAATVFADDGIQQPGTVSRTSYTASKYNSYYAQDEAAQSPSDQAPPAAAPTAGGEAAAPACACAPAAEAPAAEPVCTCVTEFACEHPCLTESVQNVLTLNGRIDPACCDQGKPCLLIDHFPCLKECRKINIAGWINQSYTWNPQNPGNGFNGPVTWTDRSNSYELNQAYIYVEKVADNKGEGLAFGYRADLLFGSDYRFNTESNLETRWQFQGPRNFANDRFYGFDYLQFYGQVAAGKTKTNIGHFLSPVGYEVIPTTGNFFPTLPYIFQYGEPFTHTGFNTTYQLSDTSTFSSGLIRGWDNFGSNNPHLGYLGTYTKTFEDKSSYATVFIWSQEPNQANTNNQATVLAGGPINNAHSPRFITTHAYTKPLTDKLTYVGQFDFAQQTDAMFSNGVGGAGSGRLARWYGWNQYLFYKVSDCWTWGTRLDFWRDEEGFRMGGFLGNTGNGGPGTSLRGLGGNFNSFAGNNLEWSVGANWKPTANTVIRPAVRWDCFMGNTGWSRNQQAFNGVGPAGPIVHPYDNGAHDWQILVGFDWITLF
jgi:hypothetical protein